MNDIGTPECSTSSVTLRPVVKHLCEVGEVLPVKTLGNIGEVDLRVLEISCGTPSVVPAKNFLPQGKAIIEYRCRC